MKLMQLGTQPWKWFDDMSGESISDGVASTPDFDLLFACVFQLGESLKTILLDRRCYPAIRSSSGLALAASVPERIFSMKPAKAYAG